MNDVDILGRRPLTLRSDENRLTTPETPHTLRLVGMLNAFGEVAVAVTRCFHLSYASLKETMTTLAVCPSIRSMKAAYCCNCRQYAARTRCDSSTIYFCPVLRMLIGRCHGRFIPWRPALECSITAGAVLDPSHTHRVGSRASLEPGVVSSLASNRRYT